MDKSADFEISNKLSELEGLVTGITAWCQQHGLPEETIYEVNLIVDEIVSNVIRHGFKDGQDHTIRLRVSLVDDNLEILLQDEGVHFNPLTLPPPDISRPMEERRPGGLGIFMVKQMTHDAQYHREGNTNVLSLRKRVSS
jgi:serine/threonine-protein kinase RsbW